MIQYPNYSFLFPLSVCLHGIYTFTSQKRNECSKRTYSFYQSSERAVDIQDNTKDSEAFVTIATRDLKIQPVTVYAH